jgi:hypothetical protein
MIRLFVDEHEKPLDARIGSSLADVLGHVEGRYLKPNRMIREILVDGLPLILEELSDTEAAEAPATIREKIEVFTASIAEVAGESIREALAYLGRVEAAIPSISRSFREFPAPADHENLRQLCEGLYWLNILSDRIRRTFQPLEGDSEMAVNVDRDQVTLLRDLVDAQEQRDYLKLSDLLERRVLPLMPAWRGILTSLIPRVAEAARG